MMPLLFRDGGGGETAVRPSDGRSLAESPAGRWLAGWPLL